MYEAEATSKRPALIIYLLDASGSMAGYIEHDGVRIRKIDHVASCLQILLSALINRSMKGEGIISPRYRVCLLAYSTYTKELFPDTGIVSLEKWAAAGVPFLQPTDQTDTASAFRKAKEILQREIPKLPSHSPSPFVCHLTDGQFTHEDPEPVAREIMQMSTPDGPVLVENIYIEDNLTHTPISDVCKWPGVISEDDITNDYAKKLFRMSSPLPSPFHQYMSEQGYCIAANARLLFPANTPQLIEMGFTLSRLTGTAVT